MADNQNLGRISMKTANRERKPFPMRADTFTSCSFGDCQPVMFEDCQPGTKSLVSHDVLVRLAPLLAPVRSRLGVRLLTKFVGMSELTENFPFLMATKPVSRGANTFVPKDLPNVTLQLLSALCLVGCELSVYAMNNSSTDANEVSSWRLYKESAFASNPSSYSSAFRSNLSVLGNIGSAVSRSNLDDNDFFSTNKSAWASAWGVSSSRPMLNIGRALGFGYEFWIPVVQPNMDYFFEMGSKYSVSIEGKDADFILPVRISGADESGTSTSHMYGLAFKMSSFGSRLRKILIGCGYELDFYSDSPRSIMPLMAYYKAYYDSFGLMLYENWENTSPYKLLFEFERANIADFTTYVATGIGQDICQWFIDFAHRLGTTFYTEEQDFVSAHIRELSVSNDVLYDSLAYVPNSPTMGRKVQGNMDTDSAPSVTRDYQGLPYIQSNSSFSQLDLEILQKAYQCVNRNTIAGQRISEILRANGLGKWVDECKSSFVGESYIPIDINDVNATADSFNTATGQQSTLGAYVGKGVGYNSSPTFVYENGEYGYMVTIACVIPESGYCQQEDPLTTCIQREDFYLPDFDGMGMEANSKRLLCAQQDFGDYDTRGSLDATFGFIPRMSRHKVSFNRLNGDFSRRSTRDGFLPYSLDKFIEIGERNVSAPNTTQTTYDDFDVVKGFKASQLPSATPNLRYVGRLPWLGNFSRVFNLEGKLSGWSFAEYNLGADIDDEGAMLWHELCGHREYDNFMLFVFRDYKQMAPMLQMEDSFETRESGNKGNTDISIGKA